MVVNLARWAKRRVVSLLISRKWARDARRLPLRTDHGELYERIHLGFVGTLGRFPDLVRCPGLNDKIQWLKLFDQDPRIIGCVDKLGVREHVQKRVGAEHLPDVFQVHHGFDAIDFETLPDSFVIKTNHDSGTVVVVPDARRFDRARARKHIEPALAQPYGRESGEWAYLHVPRRVFVEEFLSEDGRPPSDYKFFVVEGRVALCQYISDRDLGPREQLIDADGSPLRGTLDSRFARGRGFRRPAAWRRMIEIAKAVGAGFKCVRVDLYCIHGKIYVGEMTFWPMSGLYPGAGQKFVGNLLHFDRTTVRPVFSPAARAPAS